MITHLKEGDQAPEFMGTIENGETISLSEFRGKKVILYFYPKDDTPGCTAQGCNLRDNYEELEKLGFVIFGVSPDSIKRHDKFKTKYDFPFSLIADEDHKIIKDYGVWGPKKFMGREYDGLHRTTFIIDEEGKIMKIIPKVKTKHHTQQILDELEMSV